MRPMKWMLATLALLLIGVGSVRAAIEGFESGDGGYTFSGLWHVTTNFPFGGTHALGYVQNETPGATPNGDYNTGAANSGTATSPLIAALVNVPINTPMSLTFEAFNYNERSIPEINSSPVFYDTLTLTVVPVPNQGSSQMVASSHPGDAPTFIPFFDTNHPGYNLITVDLTPFDGTKIQLVFGYATFDGQFNDFPGARIDNISIGASNNPNPNPPNNNPPNNNPNPVPEPASLVLFGLGAMGMVGCAWRRRNQ